MSAFINVFPSGAARRQDDVFDAALFGQLEDCVREHSESTAMWADQLPPSIYPPRPRGPILRSFRHSDLVAAVEYMKGLAAKRSVSLKGKYSPGDTSGLYMVFRTYSSHSTRFGGVYHIVHPTDGDNMYLVDDRGYVSLVRTYPPQVPLMVPPPAPLMVHSASSVPSACL